MARSVPTIKMSPITVIIVVDVVGAIPNGHTSGGFPVSNVAAASWTNSPCWLPVMRM